MLFSILLLLLLLVVVLISFDLSIYAHMTNCKWL